MIVTDWQARHGLSAADYQAQFDQLVGRGYRLVQVTGYPVGGQARYAGIWQRRGGSAWQARHGITPPAYQMAVSTLAQQSYRPTHVSAFRLGGDVLFSAVWEQEAGLPWIARHDLTSAQYQQLFDTLSRNGYRLRCVSGYEDGGEARYACIWDEYAGPAWQARHGLDAAAYQREFDALVAQGYRLVQAAGYCVGGTPRFAGVWEQSPGHGWKARHGLPDTSYQGEFDAAVSAGFRLVDVSGYAVGAAAAYTTVWEDSSADQPSGNPVSAVVIPFMQKWAVPGLSLVVARNGTVIADRNFGYANPITRETVTPATRFRIASVSKPVTSSAIFRLIETGKLALSDRVFGAGARLGTTFGTVPYSAYVTDITIQHLLEHTAGGWQNDASDPMFAQLGLSQHDLISWTLDHRPLIDPPGTVYRYSNFGYCVLGRVIETVTGATYAGHVGAAILGPAGIADMLIAGDRGADRQWPEAMYVGRDLQAPYELKVRRMDAHGGWIATAADLVRLGLRLDGFPSPPDLLAATTIATMATPSTVNAGYAKGWAVNSVGTRWHDGTLSGTQSILVRTAAQHEWAAVCNTGVPGSQLGLELDNLMWSVDALV